MPFSFYDSRYRIQYGNLINFTEFYNRKENKVCDYFSLKRIIYPTGGVTEFEYEAHNYYIPPSLEYVDDTNVLYHGGGQRIKKITSWSDSESIPVITEYKYGYNEDGIGQSNMNLNKNYFIKNAMNLFYISDSKGNINKQYYGYQLSRTLSTEPLYPEASAFKVWYPYVTKYERLGNSSNFETKTNLFFTHDEIEYQVVQGFEYISLWPYHINEEHNYSFLPTCLSRGFKPYLSRKMVYDKNNTLKLTESYVYSGLDSYTGYEQKVRQMLFGDYSLVGKSLLYDHTYVVYKIGNYNYPLSKIITHYLNSKPLTTTQYYYYNNYCQLEKVEQIDPENKIITKYFKYPLNYQSDIYKKMVERNIILPVIEEYETIEGKEISRIKNNYASINNLILPSSKEISSHGESSLEKIISYDLYDKKGNILQYTTQDGTVNSVIWSYNYRYPIAKISNATYSEITSKLGISTDVLAQTNSPDMLKIDNLRNILNKAQITTYTYKIGIGMTSQKDPKGYSIYYEYYNDGHLKEIYHIKNNKKQILKFYGYSNINK